MGIHRKGCRVSPCRNKIIILRWPLKSSFLIFCHFADERTSKSPTSEMHFIKNNPFEHLPKVFMRLNFSSFCIMFHLSVLKAALPTAWYHFRSDFCLNFFPGANLSLLWFPLKSRRRDGHWLREVDERRRLYYSKVATRAQKSVTELKIQTVDHLIQHRI